MEAFSFLRDAWSRGPFGRGALVSPVRALFTAAAPSGSWKIRGEQIASQRSNWSATLRPEKVDLQGVQLCVIVKRVPESFLSRLRDHGIPWVLDVVDGWAQPEDGLKVESVAQARDLFSEKWARLEASGFIFPNRQMQKDLGELFPQPHTIYHHAYPRLRPRPLRQRVRRLGYQGELRFLGEWDEIIERQCRKRGMRFLKNPKDLTSVDIGVAIRGGAHNRWLPCRYKSNVKLANFYGAGLPCLVGAQDLSYRETGGDGIFYFESETEFAEALDQLQSIEVRQQCRAQLLARAGEFTVSRMAQQFEDYFLQVLSSRRAES